MSRQNIDAIGSLIKSGNLKKADRLLLQQLQKLHNKTPLRDRLQLAEYCRRLNHPYVGVKLLHSFVRPSEENTPTMDANVIAEYAANLVMIGAYDEARQLLESIRTNLPQKNLFLAFSFMAQWDYDAALQVMEQYLVHPTLTPYERLVGNLNHHASLVAIGHFDQAIANFSVLLDEASANPLIRLNIFENLLQCYLFKRQFHKAQQYLDLAISLSAQISPGHTLLLKKWAGILDLYKTGASSKTIEVIKKIQSEALASARWEIVRDCDFHLAKITTDLEIATKLFVGTPYPSYRARIQNAFHLDCTKIIKFTWQAQYGKKGHIIVDVEKGQSNCAKSQLNTGKLPHQLLLVLTSDFYRPLRLPSIFYQLYPHHYFHPLYSMQAMNQVALRLKHWLRHNTANKVTIGCNKQTYQLHFKSDFHISFLLPSPPNKDLAANGIGDVLLLETGRQYSMKDIVSIFGKSRRTCQRTLQTAIELGILKKQGYLKSTRYILSSLKN